MSNVKSDYFTVGPVVLSYVDPLFVPQPDRKKTPGSERYTVNIIYGPDIAQQIQAYVDQVGRQAFPKDYDIPNKVKKPIRQTEERPAYAAVYPGNFFSTAKSLFKPTVVDENHNPIVLNEIDLMVGQKQIYAGVLAYVSINAWTSRHPEGGPAVSLGIQAVLKYADGTPIPEGGSVDVAEVFANVPSGVTGPVPAQPATVAQPQPAVAQAVGPVANAPVTPQAPITPVPAQVQAPVAQPMVAPGQPAPQLGQPVAPVAGAVPGQPVVPGTPAGQGNVVVPAPGFDPTQA